jgi:hypothetical protein
VNPTSLTLQVIVNKSDKNYLEELFWNFLSSKLWRKIKVVVLRH